MIGNDETLQLILTANDEASAILEKVRKQIKDMGGETQRGRKGTGELGQEIDKLSDSKLTKTARAMSSVAYAAEEAKLGGREAARAMGELAETIALASGNAKFAGWAIGINAAVMGLTTFVGLLRDSAEQTKPTDQFIRQLAHTTKEQADAEREGLKASRDSLIEQTAKDADQYLTRFQRMMSANLNTQKGRSLARQGGVDFEALDHANANFEEFQKKSLIELNAQERRRVLALQDQSTEMDKQKAIELALGDVRIASIHHQVSSIDLARQEALAARKNADQQTDTMFRFRDANGKIHELTSAELAMKGQLLERNREIYRQTVDAADAKYSEEQKESKFQDQQIVWYARRRLSQNDFQNTLDDARRSYESQVHALQNSNLEAADLKRRQDAISEAYALQVELLNQQHDIQTRKQRAQNNVDAASGDLFGPGNGKEQHEARLAQIEEERLASIKAGQDEVEANRKAQNEIRRENHRVLDQAKSDYKTIEDVLLASKSRQIKAIGHAAQTIRKLEIGAEGAHDAVMALREGGLALASFARGDFSGGALHLASAAQLGAAAALAGQESLGGGASSGGGGGSTPTSTFEPRNNGGGGTQVINLYTTNPYGREQIQQVKYDLGRADVMKRPGIQIPPTTGITVG